MATGAGFKIRNAQLENPPVGSRIPVYVAEGEKTDNVLVRASEAAEGIYLGHGNRPIEYIRRDCQLIRKVCKGNRFVRSWRAVRSEDNR